MILLETKDLVKVYRLGHHEVRALAGITLRIEKGSFVAVTGRSGSGKTTLLNQVGCLDRPTSGFIFLDGFELGQASEKERTRFRRSRIGFVFQHFNLMLTMTALENVMLPLKYARVPRKEARQRAVELLETVGLEERLSHRPFELSGGEQQRVAIARSLVNRPSLVLADEPTGEVDTETAAEIVHLMKELNRNMGQTFILVSHDAEVTDKAERIIRLEDGYVKNDEAVPE